MRKPHQRGFILVELLLGLAIAGLIGSAVVGSLFQFTRVTSRGEAGLAAFQSLHTANYWLARDTQMAEATDLVDGAPPVSAMTLTWTDQFNEASTAHTSTYALVGSHLQRTYDGINLIVARNVTSAEFSISGRLITVSLTTSLPGSPGVSGEFSHYFYLRPQPI